MSHAAFITGSYLVTVLVLAGLAGWIVWDGRRQKQRLADLEARGIRRRSAARASVKTVAEKVEPAGEGTA